MGARGMATARLVLPALAVVLLPAAAGCRQCGATGSTGGVPGQPGPQAPPTAAGSSSTALRKPGRSPSASPERMPPAVAALAGFHRARPLWLEAPPAEPGLFTIDHLYGPVISADHHAVILASTALGCTALDLASGRALWRVPLPPPDGPVVAGHLAPDSDPRCPSADLTCLSPHPPAGPWPPTPVATAAGNTIEVRDERLYAIRLDTARPAWTAAGRYADCAGCLGPAPGGALWALALDSGTVVPVVVNPATGQTRRGDGAVPAIQVLAAASAPGAPGARYAALRLDATLSHDAVVAFDAGGRVTWSWIIPPPASGPRVNPMALVATRGRAVLFFDGRYAAALPPP